MRVTPNMLNNLKQNEIFVFGSNLQGNHAGGAAYFAVKKFGAEMGNGDGIQGNSYAIPTLSRPALRIEDLGKIKLPIKVINRYVKKFIAFASQHQELFFYVTPIGCGIAGFSENEIAPLFKGCMGLDNVALPESFIKLNGGEIDNNVSLTESQLRKIVSNIITECLK